MNNQFSVKELERLGFEKEIIPPEHNDGTNALVYYAFRMNDENYTMSLMSDIFEDDVKEVHVQLFEGSKNLSKEFVKAVVKEFKQ